MEVIKTSSEINSYTFGLLYGKSGIGKTHQLSTLENPLLIDLENGSKSLSSHDIDMIKIEGETALDKLLMLNKAINFIKTSDYKTVVFDSFTELSEIILEDCKVKMPDARNSLQRWGMYKERIELSIKILRDIPNKNIFLTCLEKTEKDEVGRMYKTVDLSGSIVNKFPQYFDLVMAYRFIERDDKIARIFQTGADLNYVAKDRSGRLDIYENPNLQEILNKINNKGE